MYHGGIKVPCPEPHTAQPYVVTNVQKSGNIYKDVHDATNYIFKKGFQDHHTIKLGRFNYSQNNQNVEFWPLHPIASLCEIFSES